ncbi:MAG: extracellular solute-binding protein [Microbacteriaceae bacterium]|nr:extracellular solute-binding protein [Microbacteriaceae bacterium]
MRRRIVAAVAGLTALVLALTGCAFGGSAGSDPNNPNQVEAITWWASGVEKTALYDMVAVFKTQNPELEFIDASVRGGGGAKARAAIAARLDADNPPDTFQATAGAALSDYVDAGYLQDLTGFFEKHDLRDVYRAGLLELMSVEGKIYSVPSDIHRVNVLWSNNKVLEAAGIDPSVELMTVDAWLVNLEKLRASGIQYPLALGNDWTQVQLFENVLIADLGPVLYRNLWTSTKNWEGAAFRAAIDHYSQLLEYVDPSSGSKEWTEVTRSVVEGEKAYIVMADFALSSFQRAGFITGKQYSAAPAPGTARVFDFLADSFTLPTGAVHDEAAQAWLLTVASAEGQKALSLTNGSIPARTDTVKADYPPYQQSAIESLQMDTIVPSVAHGVAADPAWTKAITTAVLDFRSTRRPDAFANALLKAAKAALGDA